MVLHFFWPIKIPAGVLPRFLSFGKKAFAFNSSVLDCMRRFFAGPLEKLFTRGDVFKSIDELRFFGVHESYPRCRLVYR